MFVNNYFAASLLAWKANLDLQPVFNYYKALSYMCSYFSTCNARSSRKHFKDLSCITRISSCDIILCTETQLSSAESVTEIVINGSDLTCNNDNEHRFSSL